MYIHVCYYSLDNPLLLFKGGGKFEQLFHEVILKLCHLILHLLQNWIGSRKHNMIHTAQLIKQQSSLLV